MARGLRGSELPSKALEKNYASARDLFGQMQGGLGNHIRQYLAPLQRGTNYVDKCVSIP